jgi:type IV pilus assembly protein PilN
MYSIDINLLKERPGFGREDAAAPMATGPVDNTPLIVGGIFGVAMIGLALLAGAGLTFRNQQLANEERDLDDQLAKIAPQLAELDKLKAEKQQVDAETQSLATIFNQIKPWSATLQDLRDRVPPGLQLVKIEQAAPPPPPSPSPGASPPPAGKNAPAAALPSTNSQLKLTGKARTFTDVNDFVLSLGKSSFLAADSTKLIQSQREASTVNPDVTLVNYQIDSAINTVPAADLLQELRLKGASGLVSRIEFLKQKGVIKK